MTKTVLSIIRQRWRELLGFALIFRLVESLIFAPLAAVTGHLLLGQTVLDSTALISFLLSARGLTAITLAAITALTIRLLEHAGLSAIFFGAFENRVVSSRDALRLVWRNLLTLIRVSSRFVGLGFLTLLPLLIVAGGFAHRLLARHDINYYLHSRPPEFLTAVVVIGVVALGTIAWLAWLVVRWRWVVQVVLFEQKPASAAFRQSVVLTKGQLWKMAGLLFVVIFVSIVLGLIASATGDVITSIFLGVMAHGMASLAVSFGLLLLIRMIFGAVCTFIGSCVDAGFFTFAYRRRVEAVGAQASLPAISESDQAAPERWLPTAVVGGLTFAAIGTWVALATIPDERAITIHAHRGVSTRAPENSLAAFREAIAAGADYIETDVQLSKDDVLVIAHDSDFSRLGGVAKKIWELTYDEIRAIPLDGHSAAEFPDEITPTLDALLDTAKGRIKVNIELKYYGDHQPGLARKVVDAVRNRGMLDQVVIQSLEYEPLLEVQKLAPEVPVGYLLSFNARQPSRLKVDFLSVQQGRLAPRFIRSAHRRGQQVYAWTINTAEEMEQLFDIGIDGIITDQSALARATLEKYLQRPPAERAVRRVRSWLAD